MALTGYSVCGMSYGKYVYGCWASGMRKILDGMAAISYYEAIDLDGFKSCTDSEYYMRVLLISLTPNVEPIIKPG